MTPFGGSVVRGDPSVGTSCVAVSLLLLAFMVIVVCSESSLLVPSIADNAVSSTIPTYTGFAAVQPSTTSRWPITLSNGSVNKKPSIDSSVLFVATSTAHITYVVQSVSPLTNDSISMPRADSVSKGDDMILHSTVVYPLQFPTSLMSSHQPSYSRTPILEQSSVSLDPTAAQQSAVRNGVTVLPMPWSQTVNGSQTTPQIELPRVVSTESTVGWTVSSVLTSALPVPIVPGDNSSDVSSHPSDPLMQIQSSFVYGTSLHSRSSSSEVITSSLDVEFTASQTINSVQMLMTSSVVHTQLQSVADHAIKTSSAIASDIRSANTQALSSFADNAHASNSYAHDSHTTSFDVYHQSSELYLHSPRRNTITFSPSEALSVGQSEITTPNPGMTLTLSSFPHQPTSVMITTPTVSLESESNVKATYRETSEQTTPSSEAISGMAEFFITLPVESTSHELTRTWPVATPASVPLSSHRESSGQFTYPSSTGATPSSVTTESSVSHVLPLSTGRVFSVSEDLATTDNVDTVVTPTYIDSDEFVRSSSGLFQTDDIYMTTIKLSSYGTQLSTETAIPVTEEANWTSKKTLPSLSLPDGGTDLHKGSFAPSSISVTSPLAHSDVLSNTVSINNASKLAHASTVDGKTLINANFPYTSIIATMVSLWNSTVPATFDMLPTLQTTYVSNTRDAFDQTLMPSHQYTSSSYGRTPHSSSSDVDIEMAIFSAVEPTMPWNPTEHATNIWYEPSMALHTVEISATLSSFTEESRMLATPRLTHSPTFFEAGSTYVSNDTSTRLNMYPSTYVTVSSLFGNNLTTFPSVDPASESQYAFGDTSTSVSVGAGDHLSLSLHGSIYPTNFTMGDLSTVMYNQSVTVAPSVRRASEIGNITHIYSSSVTLPARSEGRYSTIIPSVTLPLNPVSIGLDGSIAAEIPGNSPVSETPQEFTTTTWDTPSMWLSTPASLAWSQSTTSSLYESVEWTSAATVTTFVASVQPSVSSAATREMWISPNLSASAIPTTVQVLQSTGVTVNSTVQPVTDPTSTDTVTDDYTPDSDVKIPTTTARPPKILPSTTTAVPDVFVDTTNEDNDTDPYLNTTTTTTVPTSAGEIVLNTSVSYKTYWVVTVLAINVDVDVYTRTFRTEMETKLAMLYHSAFERQSKWQRGAWTRRVKRAVSYGNATVQMVNISRCADKLWETDLVYYVLRDGNITAADDVVRTMELFNDQEVALILGHVVISKVAVYDPVIETTTSSKLWIIGAAIGGFVVLALVVWCILFVYCSYKRRLQQTQPKSLPDDESVEAPDDESQPDKSGRKGKSYDVKCPEIIVEDELKGEKRRAVESYRRLANGSPELEGMYRENDSSSPTHRGHRNSRSRIGDRERRGKHTDSLRSRRSTSGSHRRRRRDETERNDWSSYGSRLSEVTERTDDRKSLAPARNKGQGISQRDQLRRHIKSDDSPEEYMDTSHTTMSSSTVYTINLPPLAHQPLVNGGLTPEEATRRDKQMRMTLQQKAEIERLRNKQRQREKKERRIKRLKNGDDQNQTDSKRTPIESYMSDHHASTKDEMDTTPDNALRADGHGNTPEYRDEILDHARKRIHGLLDDAFALVATRPPSRHEMTQAGPEALPETVTSAVTEERLHTPLIITTSSRPGGDQESLAWNPYKAGDVVANLSPPQQRSAPRQRPHSAVGNGRTPTVGGRGRARPASARQQYSNAAYIDDYDDDYDDDPVRLDAARPIPVTDLSGIYTTDPAPPIIIRTKSITPPDGYSSVSMDARMFSSWSPPVRDQNGRRMDRTKTRKENAVAPTSDERTTSPSQGYPWETPTKPRRLGQAWETPALDSGVRPVYDTGRDEVDIAMDVVRSGAPSQLVSSVRQELQGM